MLGFTPRNALEDIFNFHLEADRLFNRFWNELPTRVGASSSSAFQVHTTEDGWRLDVPMPGIDPRDVSLEVAGTTLSIRAQQTGDAPGYGRYEQTITVPQFLDLDRISASYRYGMLQLTLPLKESVKPRRVQIDVAAGEQKQLTTT